MMNFNKLRLCNAVCLLLIQYSVVPVQTNFLQDAELTDIDGDIPVIEGFGEPVTVPEEDDVIILNMNNFDHVVGPKELILVEFYAPWCGHCKTLVPEYAAAAKILKEDGIRIAKVDATEESELGKMFEVTGYPTIKLFKKGQVEEDFDGPRNTNGFVEYMRRHADPNYKPPPSHVVDLTLETFEEFVDFEELSVVEFFAPWCGHCKSLAPEYDGAATDLKPLGIALAKVDATVEKDLAAKYDVTGYPKLFIFRKGRKFDYKGPRARAGIVDYMKLEAMLPSVEVKTLLKVKNGISRTEPTIFAFFTVEDERFSEYIASANEMRGECTFIHTFNVELAEKYGLGEDSVNILFPDIYTSKYEKKMLTYSKGMVESKDLVKWLREKYLPLIGHRTNDNMKVKYPNRPLVVIYYDVNFSHQYVKDTLYIRNKILPVADEHRDLRFVISNEEEFKDEMKELGLDDSGEEVNVAILGENNVKYPMEPDDDYDEELAEFVQKFKDGKCKPYFKSQPVPKRQDEPVRVVVANNFEKEVFRDDKDVLIEFYAPWCGHCKELEPIYKKLAKYFAEKGTANVAKMDATANDIPPPFEVKGFPTIFLARLKNGQKVTIPFNGERTFEGLKDFIVENSSVNSERDEL